ncbi:MAG: TlpA disulfide reductase family protein [Desulfocapsaceae bacterium]|jgi:peroxiredoxin
MNSNRPSIIIAIGLACCFVMALAGCNSPDSKRLKIGDNAPDFAITDLQGREYSLDAWQGFPVILRFWDTECKFCRADTPIFNRYFDQYQERGLKVLYVATSNETRQRVERYITDLDIGFPVALDMDGRMAADYQVTIVPQTIFISPDQTIITAVLGGVSAAELEEIIGSFLQ